MIENPFDNRFFTPELKALLETLYKQTSAVETVVKEAANIVVRSQTVSLSDNTKTFVFSTSAHPNNIITYTSNTSSVDLNK